ncbi:MAG: hypothetical protein KBS56_04100 [Clostridiales bacterium]|nr:hypothetical protein [Candidatus Crickella equi]
MEVVDCLLEDEFYNFAINRAYYAAFDAMRAELADKTVCNSTVLFTPQKVRLTRHQLHYMILTSIIVQLKVVNYE